MIISALSMADMRDGASKANSDDLRSAKASELAAQFTCISISGRFRRSPSDIEPLFPKRCPENSHCCYPVDCASFRTSPARTKDCEPF